MNDSGLGNFPPVTADFLPQYKAIGQSLKKRFFRKPNVAEAIEQYENLAQELQREEQKSFAGVCYLEAAKAQDSLGQNVPQINSLLRAGKLFLGAWESEKHFVDAVVQAGGQGRLQGRGHDHDPSEGATHLFGNLELGIQTLNQAAKSFNTHGYKGLALLLDLQLGDILFRDGSYGEALNHYKTALISAKLYFPFPDQMRVTGSVVGVKIKLMEFESALKTVNDALIGIKNYESETSSDRVALPLLVASFKQKFEMTKVLLVLILGGTGTDVFEFIWPKLHVQGQGSDEGMESDDIYTTTSTGVESGGRGVGEDGVSGGGSKEGFEVTYLLKSLVIAVQEGSSQDLKHVHNKLIPFMDQPHHDLMRFLIQLQS